jgi:glycosyltransferase involved in cell wall biosynthesis
VKVLIVSNLDSEEPFGQFIRPFWFGRGLAGHGVEVGNVGVDGRLVDFGPAWSTRAKSLRPMISLTRRAVAEFAPDVVYAHEMRGCMAAVLGARGVQLVVDYHSLPSYEYAGYARGVSGTKALVYRAASRRSWLAERLGARRSQRTICAGGQVADRLAADHRPAVPPVVITNGVDPKLLETPPTPDSPYNGQSDRHVVTMLPDTPANERARRFLGEVAGELAARSPRVVAHVLGAEGEGGPTLRYEGFQPDLGPWIEHADACLMPYPEDATRFGGAMNKLLESLARGRRVITTPEGLFGLEDVADWPGVIQAPAEPAPFAEAVVAGTARDAPALDPTRAAVHERLRWDVLAGRVAEVLDDAARRGRSG